MIRVTKRGIYSRICINIWIWSRSSVLALPSERSEMRVGSDINSDRSFTMAKASASRPTGLVNCEEWVTIMIEIFKTNENLNLTFMKHIFAEKSYYSLRNPNH